MESLSAWRIIYSTDMGGKLNNVRGFLQDLLAVPTERRSAGMGVALIEAVNAKTDEAGAPQVYCNSL